MGHSGTGEDVLPVARDDEYDDTGIYIDDDLGTVYDRAGNDNLNRSYYDFYHRALHDNDGGPHHHHELNGPGFLVHDDNCIVTIGILVGGIVHYGPADHPSGRTDRDEG